MNSALDATDFRILTLLQQDSSMSIKAIASKVGLSTSPTYERINRLKEAGIIEKYIVQLNKEKLGLQMVAYCQIRLSVHALDEIKIFEDAIVQFENILEVVSLSGNYDYMLKIVIDDIRSYQHFVDAVLAQIPGIANVHSSFVMKSLKETTAFPLASFSKQ